MHLFAINRFICKTALNLKILKQNIRICANNRYYSNYYNIVPRPKDAFGPGEFDKYQSHFQDVVKYLTSFDKAVFPELNEYFDEILNYNVPGHEQAMGPLVFLAYKCLKPSELQTNEGLRLACIVGWVIDMIAISFQILDDILDSSQTRINKPCWYQNESVKLKAIQHSATIGDGAFVVLDNFLSEHPNYIPILKLTIYAKFRTSLAQTFDTMSERQCQFFTKETYRMATIYKGAYPAIIHPFCMGMYLADVSDLKIHAEIRPILEELGIYFTAQNDILDCYGNPEITGKYGSDIKVGKLTWLSTQAMTDAKPSQKELFQLHYGKSDLQSQKVIYDLFDDLKILKKFLIYEEESYNQIRNLINSSSEAIPKKPIQRIVDAFYGKIDENHK